MPQDNGARVNLSATIDEAWLFRPDDMLRDPAVKRDAFGRVISIPRAPTDTSHWFKQDTRGQVGRPGVVTLTPDQMPLHSHESIIGHVHGHMGPSHNHIHTIYKQPKIDRSDISMDVGFNVESWLKEEMRKQLIELEKEAMNTILFGDGTPINKENHMSDRQLRQPEGPIETKDLTVALKALGTYDLDYILDAVSLVQSLESNQRLVKASKLKQQDVGSHLQVVDGQGGVLTDLRDFDTFGRDNRGCVKAVVGGKMLDLRENEFVVLTALAN